MEIKIEDLVSTIKKDGIDAANAKADEIISDAKAKANKIVSDAKAEQEKILAQTTEKTELLLESARVSISQAKRDAVLLFEDAIQKKFEKILENDIKKTLSGDALASLIKAAINEENPADYVAEIAEIKDELKSELAAEIKNGLEIKISSTVKTGFRLNAKDGSGYFDCSDDEIAAMLAPFLSDIEI